MNTNTTEITIDGRQYTVNLEEAVKLGLIKEKKVKRPLQIKDIPNGSIFKQGSRGETQFVMLDNNSIKSGQMVWLSEGMYKGKLDAFCPNPWDLSYFDPNKKTWISEIEE